MNQLLDLDVVAAVSSGTPAPPPVVTAGPVTTIPSMGRCLELRNAALRTPANLSAYPMILDFYVHNTSAAEVSLLSLFITGVDGPYRVLTASRPAGGDQSVAKVYDYSTNTAGGLGTLKSTQPLGDTTAADGKPNLVLVTFVLHTFSEVSVFIDGKLSVHYNQAAPLGAKSGGGDYRQARFIIGDANSASPIYVDEIRIYLDRLYESATLYNYRREFLPQETTSGTPASARGLYHLDEVTPLVNAISGTSRGGNMSSSSPTYTPPVVAGVSPLYEAAAGRHGGGCMKLVNTRLQIPGPLVSTYPYAVEAWVYTDFPITGFAGKVTSILCLEDGVNYSWVGQITNATSRSFVRNAAVISTDAIRTQLDGSVMGPEYSGFFHIALIVESPSVQRVLVAGKCIDVLQRPLLQPMVGDPKDIRLRVGSVRDDTAISDGLKIDWMAVWNTDPYPLCGSVGDTYTPNQRVPIMAPGVTQIYDFRQLKTFTALMDAVPNPPPVPKSASNVSLSQQSVLDIVNGVITHPEAVTVNAMNSRSARL